MAYPLVQLWQLQWSNRGTSRVKMLRCHHKQTTSTLTFLHRKPTFGDKYLKSTAISSKFTMSSEMPLMIDITDRGRHGTQYYGIYSTGPLTYIILYRSVHWSDRGTGPIPATLPYIARPLIGICTTPCSVCTLFFSSSLGFLLTLPILSATLKNTKA